MLIFFKKKTKVYCKDCKYLRTQDGYHLVCTHPLNIVNSSDWYQSYKEQKRWPIQINKRNNCKWFELKEDK